MERAQPRKEGDRAAQLDPSEVVAKVNGNPISKRQLVDIIDSVDGGLSVEDALEISVRNELLAEEAERRGIGLAKEVQYAREIELARHVLKTEIGQGINAGTLDAARLRQLYEANKQRFVHGVTRNVVHIVFIVDEKHMDDEEAAPVAKKLAERARRAATKEEFLELCKPLKENYKESVRIEDLPPFDADSQMFVKEFVKAAFDVPKVGESSPAVKTKYGWHVIYVWDEGPAENRSFEDVRPELEQMVLPYERSQKANELLETLEKNGKVFVYEEALRNDFEK